MAEKDLSGKIILVTGSNTGIGRATAEQLAARGARVLLACRSRDKTLPVVDAIAAAGGEAEYVPLDLGDLESVRACARQVLAAGGPLHVLINNAGLVATGATKQGFELIFGTNHLGHFLLTKLLLPRLRDSAPARIVNVSSKAHFDAKAIGRRADSTPSLSPCESIDFEALRKSTATFTGIPEYAVSKLCNVLFTRELARGRAGEGVHSYAVHPGVVASDAWRRVPWPFGALMKRFMISTEEGARTSVYCATSPDVADDDGLYYDECKTRKPSRLAQDEALAKELWTKSEAWTADYGS